MWLLKKPADSQRLRWTGYINQLISWSGLRFGQSFCIQQPVDGLEVINQKIHSQFSDQTPNYSPTAAVTKNQIIGRVTEGCLQHVSGFSHRAKQWLVEANENQMSAARHKFTDILV